MKYKVCILVLASALLGTSLFSYTVDFPTRAVVVYRVPGCTHFIAEGPNQFLIMEWRDGYDPVQGDILLGDFKNTGYADAYYPVPDVKGAVRVCAAYVSWGETIIQYYKVCPY